MTIDKGIRDIIRSMIPSTLEFVNFSPLPLIYKEMKKHKSVYFITAYCNRCRQETVHVIHAVSGDPLFTEGGIYIKCHICGDNIFFGKTIYEFFKTYCDTCKTVTVHALYETKGGLLTSGGLNIRCLGCGRKIFLGK